MIWRVIVTRPARKDLARLPRQVQAAVLDALEQLAADPSLVDIRKLKGYEDEWRLRVGQWRVRFTFDSASHTVMVLRVLPRGSAYRK